MELKNALAEWHTATKPLPSADVRSHPLVRVEIFLKPALAKNPSVVREFARDIKELQEILKQLTHVYTDAESGWKRKQANENDAKKKAADKAVYDKVLHCLHGILEALARQIQADGDLQDHVNAALKNILERGGDFMQDHAEDSMKSLKKAFDELQSLTVKSQNWNGPPRYWPKDPNFLVLPKQLYDSAFVFRGHVLKTQAHFYEKDRDDFKSKYQKLSSLHV
jgi:hypothetical protein